MAAGFERDIEVRSGGVLLTVEERIAFGVVLADFLVVPFADDAAVFDDDAADHRVRAHVPFPALCQFQRPAHIFLVRHLSAPFLSVWRKTCPLGKTPGAHSPTGTAAQHTSRRILPHGQFSALPK